MRAVFRKISKRYTTGVQYLTNQYHIDVAARTDSERKKRPLRHDVINLLLQSLHKNELTYLEIGVKNPSKNFNKVNADNKYSVDPGVEYKENPVDFKMTSDEFFRKLKSGQIFNKEISFDVIFIDGLHLASQADKDIENALEVINDEGFIVLHDCNPPTEWHAREEHYYKLSPAKNFWNGTTWKAFCKYRLNKNLNSACINTDWGIGIITKKKIFNYLHEDKNPFYEFKIFSENKKIILNLIDMDELKNLVET